MINISIHAPREGGDGCCAGQNQRQSNFNPRPPRGGRPEKTPEINLISPISIHAPREGGDPFLLTGANFYNNISIHAPREGGDTHTVRIPAKLCISIHAPREGGDSKDAQFYL